MRASRALVAAILCLASGCGCGNRSLPAADDDAGVDGGPGDGGQPRDGAGPPDGAPDGQRPSCAPQDARSGATACGLFLGYAWDGADCAAVNCTCDGSDCDALFETYGACLGAYADCLPPTTCDELGPMECEADAACELIWYGGGCLDTTTCGGCTPNDPDCLCYERGFACVPADPDCIDRTPAECRGGCTWIEHESQLCFESCCRDESWGYCRGHATASCAAQDIDACADPCQSVVGVFWNGSSCQPLVCCCAGPDCDQTWDTWQGCLAAHRGCELNACAATGGYCDYGDFVTPTCLAGYGKDWSIADGTCGLGVCCAPCPVEGAEVGYVSHDPQACQGIDFDCFPEWVPFDNECGCGCRAPGATTPVRPDEPSGG
jgi:hypothetical protein